MHVSRIVSHQFLKRRNHSVVITPVAVACIIVIFRMGALLRCAIYGETDKE